MAVAGRRFGRDAAAARPDHRMEIDVVHHRAVVFVVQMHFHRVADAYADKRAGDFLVKRPILIGRTVDELACDLDGVEFDLHALRTALADRRRNVGGITHDVDRRIALDDLVRRMRQRHGAVRSCA